MQLINWKEKTPPDHLYPKFELFLGDFKKRVFTYIPRITYEGPEDPDIQIIPEQDNQDNETREQRLQAAKQKESPTGLDMVLQKLMNPNITPDHLKIPKNLANSKRPENKRKYKVMNSSTKPKYNPPRQ